ncbi:MAG TPA: hypothetical protein ENI23_16905 [bacterium]|nr:hypothetical protein [bacterium]
MAESDRDNNYVTSLLGTSNVGDGATVPIYADPSTQRLLVDALTSLVGNATLVDGRKTVSSNGTAEALGSTTAIKKITIQAFGANTDAVAVGASTVVAADGTERGIILMPFQSIDFTNDDLADIFVDSRVNDEGVSFIYEV